MKCSKCNSSFIVKTDDKKFICRKCKSFVNKDGTFLNKLSGIDKLTYKNAIEEKNDPDRFICCMCIMVPSVFIFFTILAFLGGRMFGAT